MQKGETSLFSLLEFLLTDQFYYFEIKTSELGLVIDLCVQTCHEYTNREDCNESNSNHCPVRYSICESAVSPGRNSSILNRLFEEKKYFESILVITVNDHASCFDGFSFL